MQYMYDMFVVNEHNAMAGKAQLLNDIKDYADNGNIKGEIKDIGKGAVVFEMKEKEILQTVLLNDIHTFDDFIECIGKVKKELL